MEKRGIIECIHYPGEIVSKKHCAAAKKKAQSNPNDLNRKCADCNIEQVSNPSDNKVDIICQNCGIIQPVESFRKSHNSKFGREIVCKKCVKARIQETAGKKRDLREQPHITIRFQDEKDQTLFQKFTQICKSERRTREDQLIFILEMFVFKYLKN